MVLRAGLGLARPHRDRRNTIATFADRTLGATERRVTGVRIDILPCTVVGRVENQRVLIHAGLAQLVHDAADAGVELDDRMSIFRFDIDLCSNSGAGMFGWWTFMKLTLMKNGWLGVSWQHRRGTRWPAFST